MEFTTSCTIDELGDYLIEKGVPPDSVTKFTGRLIAELAKASASV